MTKNIIITADRSVSMVEETYEALLSVKTELSIDKSYYGQDAREVKQK